MFRHQLVRDLRFRNELVRDLRFRNQGGERPEPAAAHSEEDPEVE